MKLSWYCQVWFLNYSDFANKKFIPQDITQTDIRFGIFCLDG